MPPPQRWPRCSLPAEHRGDLRDGFFFEGGTGAAAVERVVIGIDPGGQGVGGAGDWVRRLEHLSGVERMEVWVVVLELGGDFGHHGG